EVPVRRRTKLEVERLVLDDVGVVHLAVIERGLAAAAGHAVADGAAAEAAIRERDVPALENAIGIIDVILKAADGADSSGRLPVARHEPYVLQTAVRIGVVFRKIGAGLEDVLAPALGGVRA